MTRKDLLKEKEMLLNNIKSLNNRIIDIDNTLQGWDNNLIHSYGVNKR